jgi:hypothetical protein
MNLAAKVSSIHKLEWLVKQCKELGTTFDSTPNNPSPGCQVLIFRTSSVWRKNRFGYISLGPLIDAEVHDG